MSLKHDMLRSALAGFFATVPMTISMLIMHKKLPWWQRAPLPPHQVTSNTLEALGMEALDEKHHEAVTLAGHFAYGTTAGILYPVMAKLSLPAFVKGTLYGIGVWIGSYMGWIPASGLLHSTPQRPLHRNLLMIIAHIVWGSTIGILFEESKPHHIEDTKRS